MVFCSETRNLNCGIPEIKSKKDGILDRKRYSFFKCGRFKPRTHNFRLYDYRVSKKQLLIRAIPFFKRLFGAPFSLRMNPTDIFFPTEKKNKKIARWHKMDKSVLFRVPKQKKI